MKNDNYSVITRLDRGIQARELNYPVKPDNDKSLWPSFQRRRESTFKTHGCPTKTSGMTKKI